MRRVLITGAAGFVGAYLTAHLAAHHPDWSLVGTTLDADPPSDLVQCDLRDASAVTALVARVEPDAVVHLAGQSNVAASFADAEGTLTNNILGTLHLLEACRAHANNARLLIVSSAEVYGPTPPEAQPLHEDRPLAPVSPYAVSKAAHEMLALQYARTYGLDVVVVRPFNHIGPGQTERFAVSSFAKQVAAVERGTQPSIRVGNLDAARDFTDVRDVVRAYDLLLHHGASSGVYNIGRGVAQTLHDVLEMLRLMAHVPVPVEVDPARLRPSDVPLLVADISRLRAATGWTPQFSLAQTLRDTLTAWREAGGRNVPH